MPAREPDTYTEAAEDRLSPEAVLAIRSAIADAGGHEVFFVGTLDEVGRVDGVRVAARGHAGAVPAVLEGLKMREVVLHNHPSGNLTPSEADLHLAAIYSMNGHGVYIVDNRAERVYVVIEPFVQGEEKQLSHAEITGALGPGGLLQVSLPDYEPRPQQAAMAQCVAQAFNEAGIAVIEAPTGVGKSLAYLLPALRWAQENRERIVVSTRTINLQEQLIDKDLPMLRRMLPRGFNACLVKGRGNYLCWRRLEQTLSEAQLFDDPAASERLAALEEWAKTTKDGSKESLPFVPGRDLWEQVSCEPDSCSLRRCPNPENCFVGRARRDMAKADVLVVNHYLLFSDLAIKREAGDFTALGVLPVYRRLILDEAHNIEDAATEYLGLSATRLGAQATFGRLRREERGRERGLLPLIKLKLIKDCPKLSITEFEKIDTLLTDRILPALEQARSGVLAGFDALREYASAHCEQIGRDVKWRLTEDALAQQGLRELHSGTLLPAAEETQSLVLLLNQWLKRLRSVSGDDEPESPLATEVSQVAAYARRLERLSLALAEIAAPELAPNTVRWIEINAGDARTVRLVRCPLEVGALLNEAVYETLKTVVMTSATLTVNRGFDYFTERLGLPTESSGRIVLQRLDSPFNYNEQARIVVIDDLPTPESRDFGPESVQCIADILDATQGHALVLFTAFRALEDAARYLRPRAREAGFRLLVQGEANRSLLLEQFRADTSSVLLATDSFWEGVDVAGDALQCVILVKLPFRVPSEPVLEARAEAIAARGGNAFMEYTVPMAVLKLRQGVGRLIRRRSDRGVVVVLDSRVLSRPYGRVFLRSLPPMPLIEAHAEEAPAIIRRFLRQPPPATEEEA